MTRMQEFRKGLVEENSVAVLLLGLCPAAAVSTRVIDALWMSAGIVTVLFLSSLCMSLLARAGGPAGKELRSGASAGRWMGVLAISSCLTASFEIVLLAFAPQATASLGIYAPLIAVNCLVLTGIDAASRTDSVGRSLLTAAGKGIGFAAALVVIAVVREILGAGTVTLFPIAGFSGTVAIPALTDDPARAFGLAGGGLVCLGFLAGAVRAIRRRALPVPPSKDGLT
jgi:electron transport complex protein RnfE